MDETSIRGSGPWDSLERAVEKTGQPIDFRLTAPRDELAAKRFLTQAMCRHGVSEKITIDAGEATADAVRGYNEVYGTAIIIRQVGYLNNRVEARFVDQKPNLNKVSGDWSRAEEKRRSGA